MSASDYNDKKMKYGYITADMITELTEFWQRGHGLVVDGYFGPTTTESVLAAVNGPTKKDGKPIDRYWPLRTLPDGRRPHITSGFYTKNPSRPTHNGIDLFFQYYTTDPQVQVGNGGAVVRNGQRRWWYPDNWCATAAADGEVLEASLIGTGHRCWVDHGNGIRTGYFHGEKLLVKPHQIVKAGDPLIVVGDSPTGFDAKHLHFEVSPIDKYRPTDPEVWLRNAKFLPYDEELCIAK